MSHNLLKYCGWERKKSEKAKGQTYSNNNYGINVPFYYCLPQLSISVCWLSRELFFLSSFLYCHRSVCILQNANKYLYLWTKYLCNVQYYFLFWYSIFVLSLFPFTSYTPMLPSVYYFLIFNGRYTHKQYQGLFIPIAMQISYFFFFHFQQMEIIYRCAKFMQNTFE